jgi:hypothetical protein
VSATGPDGASRVHAGTHVCVGHARKKETACQMEWIRDTGKHFSPFSLLLKSVKVRLFDGFTFHLHLRAFTSRRAFTPSRLPPPSPAKLDASLTACLPLPPAQPRASARGYLRPPPSSVLTPASAWVRPPLQGPPQPRTALRCAAPPAAPAARDHPNPAAPSCRQAMIRGEAAAAGNPSGRRRKP